MELPMPATQISFADFALAAQQAATPCTPPTDSEVELRNLPGSVVAHADIGGGGCTLVFEGALLPFRGVGFVSLRNDCDWQLAHWSGDTMDAPDWLPVGSHAGVNLYGSCVVASSNRFLRGL